MKRKKPRAKQNGPQEADKPLAVRYAEILRLRQAVQETQLAAKARKKHAPASE